MPSALVQLGLTPNALKGLREETVQNLAHSAMQALAMIVHPDRNDGRNSPAQSQLSGAQASLDQFSLSSELKELGKKYRFLDERQRNNSYLAPAVKNVNEISDKVVRGLLDQLHPNSLLQQSAVLEIVPLEVVYSATSKSAHGRAYNTNVQKKVDVAIEEATLSIPVNILQAARDLYVTARLTANISAAEKRMQWTEEFTDSLNAEVTKHVENNTIDQIPEPFRKIALKGLDLKKMEAQALKYARSLYLRESPEKAFLELEGGVDVILDNEAELEEDQKPEVERSLLANPKPYFLGDDGSLTDSNQKNIGKLIGFVDDYLMDTFAVKDISASIQTEPSENPRFELLKSATISFNDIFRTPLRIICPSKPNAAITNLPIAVVMPPGDSHESVNLIGRVVAFRITKDNSGGDF